MAVGGVFTLWRAGGVPKKKNEGREEVQNESWNFHRFQFQSVGSKASDTPFTPGIKM